MENLEKFVKTVSSLDNYWVLGQQESEVIVGTNFVFSEYYEIKHPVGFNVYRNTTERTIGVYFIVSLGAKLGKLSVLLQKKGAPVLQLNIKNKKDLDKEKLLATLDEFAQASFALRPHEIQHKANNLRFMM